MPITFVGIAVTPADNSALDDTPASSLTPVPGMVTGDLIYLIGAVRSSAEAIAIAQAGGQSWTSETLRQSASSGIRAFWARFNGTWGASPSVVTSASFNLPFSMAMLVFRPSAGTNTWAIDVGEVTAVSASPVAPYDITATGRTTLAASTVSLFTWFSQDDNQWVLQSGSFTTAGSAQYRNTAGSQISLSFAYKIQSSAGATGNVTNRQSNGPDYARWLAITFKEQSSGVTIADAGDELYHHGETGIPITGTSFGASQGAGRVVISPTDDIDDADAVAQTVTAWADTSITFTADLDTFTPFAQLYLFIESNSGQSNSNGRPVKREARMRISDDLESLAGVAFASQTGLHYRVTKNLNDATALLSGTTETTDGSAILTTDYYTLTEGGALAVNDFVLLQLVKPGVAAADTVATCVAYDPTYS